MLNCIWTTHGQGSNCFWQRVVSLSWGVLVPVQTSCVLPMDLHLGPGQRLDTARHGLTRLDTAWHMTLRPLSGLWVKARPLPSPQHSPFLMDSGSTSTAKAKIRRAKRPLVFRRGKYMCSDRTLHSLRIAHNYNIWVLKNELCEYFFPRTAVQFLLLGRAAAHCTLHLPRDNNQRCIKCPLHLNQTCTRLLTPRNDRSDVRHYSWSSPHRWVLCKKNSRRKSPRASVSLWSCAHLHHPPGTPSDRNNLAWPARRCHHSQWSWSLAGAGRAGSPWFL